VNSAQDREVGGIEGVQARGWELKYWSPSPLDPRVNAQVEPSNTKASDLTRVAEQAYRLGHQAYSLGNARAAFDHLQTAIETDPGCVKAHRWFARIALELGLGTEAKRSFETLIRLQGYSPTLGQNLEYAAEISRFGLEAASGFRAGCEAQKNGSLNDASLAFGRAVAAAPNHQRAWARLGQILLELKSYDGAVIACERALALEPYDSGSAYRLRLASKHTVSRAAPAGVALEAVLDPKTHVSIKLSARGRR
jgi:tetratricopeptide (TPR) repeat protein